MFTGLVESLAEVVAVVDEPPGMRILVRAPSMSVDAVIGESIAMNGCCLTVVAAERDLLAFQAGPETLSRTNLGELVAGGAVNLERSLRVGDRLGGHFVTGHIDGVGTLDSRDDEGDWATLWFRASGDLTRQMVVKGSVAVDGVSLTLVDVEAERFCVQLIPHTLAVTTLGKLAPGGRVNLETDMLIKAVQKLVGIPS